MNNSKFLSVALEASQAAEKIILDIYHQATIDFEFKSDLSPVTITDQKAEEVIKSVINKAFPDHGFMGEESGGTNASAEYIWIIDPIDGTKNFTRHVPFFGCEIALMHEGSLIVGVSNIPAQKQLSWAEKGKGAFCNGEPINVSQIAALNLAYLSFGNLKYFEKFGKTEQLTSIANDCYQARGLGDSLSYHFLAKGSFDAVVEAKVNIWDIAAVAVIIEEAGGKITDLEGLPLNIYTKSVLATNGLLHDQILKYFK